MVDQTINYLSLCSRTKFAAALTENEAIAEKVLENVPLGRSWPVRLSQTSVLHSHWSRSNEPRLSLVESFRVLLAPAKLCHKDSYHARKGPIVGALMP